MNFCYKNSLPVLFEQNILQRAPRASALPDSNLAKPNSTSLFQAIVLKYNTNYMCKYLKA